MPMITAEVFAPINSKLQDDFANILHRNAVDYLKFVPDNLVIKVCFSVTSDKWYFNLLPLDPLTSPSFYVCAAVPAGSVPKIDIVRFVVETRNDLQEAMFQAYPGTTYPSIPDRTKVDVVDRS